MASPQKEDGYTPIANEILDHLLLLRLPGDQWRVLLSIVRRTYGWNRKTDYIANRQITKMTGLCDSVVCRNLKSLADQNLITRSGKVLGLQKDYDLWKSLTATSKNFDSTVKLSSSKSLTETSKKFDKGVKQSEKQSLTRASNSLDRDVKQSLTVPSNFSTDTLYKDKKDTLLKISTKLSPNPFIAKMQKALGYPEKLKTDPIPNPAKEAMFIKKMLARGFTEQLIFDTWLAKVRKRGEFVSMVYVNNDIGGRDAKNRFPGSHREYTEPPEDD